MALVTCPDCGKQVSEKAPTCVGCGAPIASATDLRNVGVPLTTVQGTSKRLKGHILMSALVFWGSLIWVFSASSAAASSNQVPNLAVPTILLFAGLSWYIAVKFRIWWEHK